MDNKLKYTNIDDYTNQFDSNVRFKLTKLREVINNAIPNVVEKISYGMPTFYLKENIIHFAAYENHIGIYPTPSAIIHFKNDLTKFKTSKGAFQIPIDSEIPYDLIRRIVIFRLSEINKPINT